MLAGILRTDIPIAVTSAKAEAEAQALSESLRGHGYDVINVREKEISIERSTSSARTPLPASSVLIATGGSSGNPKVVINSWIRTVGHRPRAVRPSSVMNWRAGQRQLAIGPFHHAAPLTFFTEGLTDGNTLLVPQRFDAAAVIAAITDWQVEWLNATPYHLRHLAAALRARHDPALPSVRGLLHLAAPCPDRLKRDWIDLLGPDRVFEMYGATEGIGLTVARGDEWLQHPGTVGRGFFTEIRVLDSDGRQLPVGETGHIYMRSGSAARRHYFQEEHGVRTADGFATVGDQGWIDGEGYLYLASRQLTRIQVGGETVDPAEIESILARHPEVVEAAVAGIPDERLGESLMAFIISTRPTNTKLMRAYLRERLAPHKVPRVLSFVDELPHTEIGKIDRVKLKELASMPLGRKMLLIADHYHFLTRSRELISVTSDRF
jgi:bile acid-coenzyme A ligase